MAKKKTTVGLPPRGGAQKSPATKGNSPALKTGRARPKSVLSSSAGEIIKAMARFPDENPHPVLRFARDGALLYANKASRPLLDTWGGRQGKPLPGVLQSLVAEIFRSRTSKEVEVECKKGRIFSLIFVPIIGADYVNVYGRDITQRKRTEEALKNTLVGSLQTQKEISALLAGARAILEYREFKDAARSIFDTCKNLTGAPSGYVALLTKDGNEVELLFLEAGGLPCTVDPNLPMPIRGLREVAYRVGKTVYDNNFPRSPWVKFMPPGHVKLDNVMFAPLIIEKKTVGLLGLANKPGGFTENDVRLAAAFGDLAAIALQNSRTLESLEQSNESLRKAREQLEQRVEERTAELVEAIAQLRVEVEERWRAQEELKSFAKKMETIINSSSDFIVLKDKDFRFLLVNEGCGKFFNAPVKEIIGKTDFDFMPPEAAQECRRSDEKALNSDGPVENEERVGDKWLHVVKQKVVTSEGKKTGIVAVIRDITERKQAEEALRQSEQECRFLSSQLLLTQEQERKRISHELHDGIGQTLSAIKFRLEHVLQPGSDSLEQEKIHHLTSAISMIQRAVEEIRGICMDLRPTILDDLGILATMNWFCREFQTSYPDIQIEQEINLQEGEIPSLVKIVIYRVLQETFNNIAQHSQAKNVRLGLRQKDGNLELLVEDNGHGFSAADKSFLAGGKRGMGISSMRERVELSGGTFAIDSMKGTGTKVQAVWKVKKSEK